MYVPPLNRIRKVTDSSELKWMNGRTINLNVLHIRIAIGNNI